MSEKDKNNQPGPSTNGQQHPDYPPHMLAAMYGMQQGEEIDLLEYWRIIWKRRWLIIGIAFAAAVLAAGYSLTLPNIYRAEVLLAPVTEDGRKGGGLSALGGLSGLASLAGVSVPGGGNVEENLAVLKSREFLWKFIKDQKLTPVLFEDAWDADKKTWKENDSESQPSQWDAYRALIAIMNISQSKKSNLITVAVEWSEPEIAAEWANRLIIRLNTYLRQLAIERSAAHLGYLHEDLAPTQVADMRQTLFDLISQEQKKAMLANTQEQFAFQVLDAAVAPDKKTKPRRSLIVILAVLVSGFLTVVGVFVEESMRKKKGTNDL